MKLVFCFILISLLYACNDSYEIDESPEKINSSEKVDSNSTSSNAINNIPREVDTLWIALPEFDPIAQMQETDLSENKALNNYLNYLKEEMKMIPNPVKAKYEGTDFGDYFHLTFVTSSGHYLDFADGNNNYGKYELFDTINFDENRKYVGKTFEVHWEYKKSLFPCCDGEMEGVVAKVPSITKLILIE